MRAATHEYWPPATGYIEHISAMGIATASVRSETPMKLKIITGGPPELTPTMKTPLNAVHLLSCQWCFVMVIHDLIGSHDVTTLKLKPIMLNRPNERLSSEGLLVYFLLPIPILLFEYQKNLLTLLIAQILEPDIFVSGSFEDLFFIVVV